MARVKSLESMNAEIESKQKDVEAKKIAYENAVKAYKEACEKRDAMLLKEINVAIEGSTKSLEDVLEYLRANKKEESK